MHFDISAEKELEKVIPFRDYTIEILVNSGTGGYRNINKKQKRCKNPACKKPIKGLGVSGYCQRCSSHFRAVKRWRKYRESKLEAKT